MTSPAHGIPAEYEIWQNTDVGDYFVVYFVPGSQPPIPMAWQLDGIDELRTLVGPGGTITVDHEYTSGEILQRGTTFWGKAIELDGTVDHPFDAWANLVDSQAEVRPWLRDEEVLTLIAQALLEGREVTEAEFQQTDWWRTHNADQRQWLLFAESDPASATQFIEDSKIAVYQLLLESGVSDPSQELVDYMALRRAHGDWSETYLLNQISAVSDPFSGLSVDSGLVAAIGGIGNIDTNLQHEERVRSLVTEWLGPIFGAWSDDEIGQWASRFRQSPDAQDELVAQLRQQRLALFPEYVDPTLSYDNIAQPWRSLGQQLWGQTMDETDPFFTQIVRMNDVTEAGKLLTREGLTRGIDKVVLDTNESIERAFGTGVATLQRR